MGRTGDRHNTDAPQFLGVRIEKSFHERLKVEATRRDVNISYLVRRAIEARLPEWEAQELP